jgi:hypothetical protein
MSEAEGDFGMVAGLRRAEKRVLRRRRMRVAGWGVSTRVGWESGWVWKARKAYPIL